MYSVVFATVEYHGYTVPSSVDRIDWISPVGREWISSVRRERRWVSPVGREWKFSIGREWISM